MSDGVLSFMRPSEPLTPLVVLVGGRESRGIQVLSLGLVSGPLRMATCSSEEVAIQYAAQTRPDAVVLDAQYLYLEGRAAHDRITRVSPRTRVYYLDIEGDHALFVKVAADSGGTDHLTVEPCDLNELGKVFTNLLKPPSASNAA